MPEANKNHIRQYWPVVYMALDELGLDYEEMLLMALGTIAAETGNFNITVREFISQYNTSPNGRMMSHYFDLYDHRGDLGNTGEPDGKRYRGGGAIQLTGRYNYRDVGRKLKIPLEDHPDLIENPIVSARALAMFLHGKENEIREALGRGDMRQARRLVNGGSHGLDRFESTYRRGESLIAENN
jgi:peptidoglycan L-alanyl-D-glutamate endopeptidase CwlK